MFSDPTEEAFERIQKKFEGKSAEEQKRFDKISEFYFKHFVEPYGVDEAENAFFSILKEAIVENEKNSVLIPEKFEEICEIYQDFKEIFGDETLVKFYPAFATGSVVVKVSGVNLNGAESDRLKNVLERCNTFEISPLINGKLDLGVTIKGLFESKN